MKQKQDQKTEEKNCLIVKYRQYFLTFKRRKTYEKN
jgi:hypothetical protein